MSILSFAPPFGYAASIRCPVRNLAVEVTVISLHGEHDASTATDLSETIRETIDLHGTDLILDLRNVTFMSAATIGVIINANNLCQARSLTLRLRQPLPCARRIIKLCDLHALVENLSGIPVEEVAD